MRLGMYLAINPLKKALDKYQRAQDFFSAYFMTYSNLEIGLLVMRKNPLHLLSRWSPFYNTKKL